MCIYITSVRDHFAAGIVSTSLSPTVPGSVYIHICICNKYTPTCIYTGMDFFFTMRGAREEAGTGGDEVEAEAAAKVVTYVRN